MFRRPNRVWALPITLVLVPGYLVAAGLLQSYLVPADGIYLLFVWLCVYNAVKFLVTGPIAFLLYLVDYLVDRARRRRRRASDPVAEPLPGLVAVDGRGRVSPAGTSTVGKPGIALSPLHQRERVF